MVTLLYVTQIMIAWSGAKNQPFVEISVASSHLKLNGPLTGSKLNFDLMYLSMFSYDSVLLCTVIVNQTYAT